MIVSLYLFTTAWLERFFRIVKACFDGVWLGVLSRERLHAIDALYYHREKRYADEEYNRGGLWPWEQAALDRFFVGCTRVVVTGAGGGREVLALRKLGYDAIGFECNPQLAAIGDRLLASEGQPGRLSPAPRDAWPGTAGPCDGVIVGWGSYMLIQGRAHRVEYLQGARACLPEGAPILVSFFARGGTPISLRIVAVVGSALRKVRGQPPVEMGDALQRNYVHYFTRAEIVDELAEGGFALEFYDTKDYGVAIARAVKGERDEHD
ncbi:MAG: SAM-dependent methyltransferase [Egibacteraceae bacterium]